MKRIHIVLYALCYIGLSMIASGCGSKEEFVARINDETISSKELDSRIAKLPDRYRDVVSANKKNFLDELISDKLLYGEAIRRGLDKDKEVKEVIDEARKKILIARLIKDTVEDKVKVTDQDVRDYYEKNQKEFMTPEILRASHIMVKTEAEANDIVQELARGSNFEDLARSRSIDPSAAKGGDIGYFVVGQLDPDFEAAAVQMREGELKYVVKTRFGYHIIKLTERKPPNIERFKDVEERLRHNLLVEKRKKAFNDLVESLKKNARIQINDKSPALASQGKAAPETPKAAGAEKK
ncbi:MAG: peptidylprolyl isomerase [Candidatus Omnitrophica bacterium]|nr:peptidylprolyl isomerase [Candidatus Omnitrophota bacterium]